MKCEASDELTTSTFLMPDWYSWLIRWNTRSDPDRSTSIWIFGYSARKALAISSATLTSIDEYHTTLPSLAAAASIAGVVSCPAVGAAIAQPSSTIRSVLTQFHLMVIPLPRLSDKCRKIVVVPARAGTHCLASCNVAGSSRARGRRANFLMCRLFLLAPHSDIFSWQGRDIARP